jgi:hypothetical protein
MLNRERAEDRKHEPIPDWALLARSGSEPTDSRLLPCAKGGTPAASAQRSRVGHTPLPRGAAAARARARRQVRRSDPMPPARRIASAEERISIHAAGSGFVIDPFNRRIHTASCARVRTMGLGDPKWFAPDESSALSYLQQRMTSYVTAQPIVPCSACGQGIPSRLRGVERSAREARPAFGTRSIEASVFRSHVSPPNEKRVDAWSVPQRLAYSDTTVDLRDALRVALAALRAEEDEVVHGVLESPVLSPDEWNPPDAENVLFYNLQSPQCLAEAAGTGLRFERVFRRPIERPPELLSALHHYLYEVTELSAGFRHWRRGSNLASWRAVECDPFDDFTPTSHLWRVLRTAPLAFEPTPAEAPPEHFGLSIQLTTSSTANAAALVKKCVDCTVAAFQVHTDPVALDEIAGRLARILSEDPDGIEKLLRSSDRSVLGTPAHARGRLVRPHGDLGVAFCPDDDRCVAGEVLLNVDSSRSSWLIAGEVFSVEPDQQDATAP